MAGSQTAVQPDGGSWIPLKSLIQRRLLRRSPGLAGISSRSWTICPAEASSVPAAIYLDDSIDRVRGVGVSTSRDNELRRVKGGRVEHAATVAHEIRGAHLLDGSLYAGAWRWQLARGRTPFYWRGDCVVETSAALACTFYGSFYFGHWMRDDLSLALAAAEIDKPVITSRTAFRHEPGYRELLDAHPLTCAACVFDRIVLIEDFSQNSSKRRRYEELRARLAARIPEAACRRVYLRRGTMGALEPRTLLNGAQIESFLVARGFVIVDPDRLSSEELCRQLRGARIVVAVEGSHLAHAIYAMAADGVICALQPPHRFNNIYKDYADCAGMRYAFVVGTAADCGFAIGVDDLMRTLEKIEDECGV
jgi:Glycosyltransferase 61